MIHSWCGAVLHSGGYFLKHVMSFMSSRNVDTFLRQPPFLLFAASPYIPSVVLRKWDITDIFIVQTSLLVVMQCNFMFFVSVKADG